MKRILSTILLLVLVVACVFAVSACKKNKNHQHSYEKIAVSPTCTEAGYYIYKCSCDDSYTEAGPAALGHDMVDRKGVVPTCTAAGYYDYEECSRCGYSTKEDFPAIGHCYVIQDITYPTYEEDGERTLKCSVCNAVDTQKLQAHSKVLPQVSRLIGALLTDTTIKAHANEIVIVNGYQSNREDNYRNNEMNFVAVKLAEINLESVDGLPKGYFKLELLNYEEDLEYGDSFTAVEPNYKRLGEIYAYLNGEVISYEILSPNAEKQEGSFDVSAIFYQALMAYLHMDFDTFNKLAYVVGEFTTVADDLLNLVKALYELDVELPLPTEEYGKALSTLINSVLDGVLVEKTLANGNTQYTTNVKALKALLDEFKGHTLATYLNKVMGEGTAENVRDFAESLPSMKIKDIANGAITFAEESGMSCDDVFAFIDLVVYAANGQSISIKSLVYSSYNLTLAEAIGADEEELAQQITSAADQIFEKPIEEYVGGFDKYVELLDQIDEVANITFVLDAEGYLVSFSATVDDMFVLELDENSFSAKVYTMLNGEKVTLLDFDAVIENGEIVSFELDVNRISGNLLRPVPGLPGDGEYPEEPMPVDVHESERELEDVFEATYSNGTLVVTSGDVVLTLSVSDYAKGSEVNFSAEIDGAEIILLRATDDGNGNLTLDVLLQDVDGKKIANVDLDYSEVYIDGILDAQLSIYATVRGYEAFVLQAVVNDNVLEEAYVSITPVSEKMIHHEGYWEQVWIEDGYWDYVWNEDLGYYEEVWIENGYWSDNYVPGYDEHTGTYEAEETLEILYTNTDNVYSLYVTFDGVQVISIVAAEQLDGLYTITADIKDGPSFTLGAQQVGDGVRLVFELPEYIAEDDSYYYVEVFDEFGGCESVRVPYNYSNYLAILVDIYLEVSVNK